MAYLYGVFASRLLASVVRIDDDALAIAQGVGRGAHLQEIWGEVKGDQEVVGML